MGTDGRPLTRLFAACAALCLAAAPAADQGLTPEILRDPARALKKTADPLALAERLLEAGAADQVRAHAQELPPKKADLRNKLTGLLAFYEGELGGTLQALELVQTADAWTQERRRRAAALLSAMGGFTESASDHFRMRTAPDDAFLRPVALPALESARRRMDALLGASAQAATPTETKVLVELHPDPAQFSLASTLSTETLERSGAIGICKFRRLMALSPRATPLGYRWVDALAHEYNHYLINELSGALCPLWLHEGLARFYEDAWRREGPFRHTAHAEQLLARAVRDGTLVAFQRMEPSMVYLDNQEQVALAFAQVSDAAAYIAERFGEAKIGELLAAFRRLPRAEAFTAALGVGEGELEAAWRASLAGRAWSAPGGAMGQAIRLSPPADELEFVGADAAGHLRLGDQLRLRRRDDAALLQYNKALETEPDNGVALLKAARARHRLGQNDKARELLAHAMDKNPAYVTPFLDAAELAYDDGLYEQSRALLKDAMQINPFHPKIHELEGTIATDLGEFPAARAALERALRLDPNNAALRTALEKMPDE